MAHQPHEGDDREYAPNQDAAGIPYTTPDYGNDVGGMSRTAETGDDGWGPERLFSLLEEAVPRPEGEPRRGRGTTEDAQRRRELVEQTWEQVRKWLWSHSSQEERAAAACIRGQADVTPLHLMFRLGYPPTDVVNDLVEAEPEIVSYVDSHGWLPLHHACAYGASPEVFEILTTAYPESRTAQDNQRRTPLHFYATRNADNNPTVMEMLCAKGGAEGVDRGAVGLPEKGASELPDKGGMLPMHYACAYGTSAVVLKVLANAYPESLTVKENKGRTPMHLAMVNAHRDASPGVLRFLLEGDGKQTVDWRDDEGNLPIHLLNLGVRGLSDDPEKMENATECLKLYLAANPIKEDEPTSPDFLAALQDLPDPLRDEAVVSRHVQDILNRTIVRRFPTSILMLDGYMLLLIIICFEMTTIETIDLRSGVSDAEVNFGLILCLYAGALYFLLRELIQVVALWSLGALTSWFQDTTNWLDMTVITLVLYYSILMTPADPTSWGLSDDAFRAGVAFTKGVLWMAEIYFLKSTQVDFAVFLGGVFYVVNRLVAFLLAVGVILLAFAQMFFIVYKEHPVCTVDNIYPDDDCDFPHCSFETSLLKVYTMMMGEIGTETRYHDVLVAQILYVGYAFLVVILLSNVLIAIVTDSYEIIQNDRAAIVFWSNRLDFVAEMDGIASVVTQRILCMKTDEKGARGAPSKVQEGPNRTTVIDSEREDNDLFEQAWETVIDLFDSSQFDDVEVNFDFWVFFCYQGFALLIIIPVWFVLGVVTAGILWPIQIRKFLFRQGETAVSRAELERQKLDQLREIQTDIKSLKTEIRKEMASDREEMMRMKAEVEAVQSEVLSDLQQVRDLMTTLLDLGGIAHDVQ